MPEMNSPKTEKTPMPKPASFLRLVWQLLASIVVILTVFFLLIYSWWLADQKLVSRETVELTLAVIYALTLCLMGFFWFGVLKKIQRGERQFRVVKDSLHVLQAIAFEAPFFTGVMAFSLIALAHLMSVFTGWITDPSTSKDVAYVVAVLVTVLFGTLLFVTRLYRRFLYGVFEVASALLVAVYQVGNVSNAELLNPGFALAFLTASVYLMVRGLDNIHTALKAPIPDPSLRFFLKPRRWKRRDRKTS